MITQPACPLCTSPNNQKIDESTKREFFSCETCHLVFVPDRFHLNDTDEKKIYDHHENNPEDQGYRQFLNKLAEPVMDRIPQQSKGLDFGSGPGPTLHLMFEEHGYEMAHYDKFYQRDERALNQNYDFITSTEVIEHLANPNEIFEMLFSRLNSKGVLGLMTKLVPENQSMSSWHYTKDPTHITFYRPATLQFIAERFNSDIEILGPDVMIFTKRD